MYVVWKKRAVSSRCCPRCGAPGQRGKFSWIPVVVESRRVRGMPRQVHVLRMPAIRECCLASSDARAGWWQEVDELLARFDLWQQERLWYKLFEKVSPPDDDDFEAAMPPANRLEEAVAVLGIAWPCPATELKKAYRQLAKLHHPDLGGKAEGFQRLQHAYELLSRLAA